MVGVPLKARLKLLSANSNIRMVASVSSTCITIWLISQETYVTTGGPNCGGITRIGLVFSPGDGPDREWQADPAQVRVDAGEVHFNGWVSDNVPADLRF